MSRLAARRKFVCELGILVAGLALPAKAFADRTGNFRIAVLNSSDVSIQTGGIGRTLVAELDRMGYVQGRNVSLEVRSADNHPDRLPSLARELVQWSPDVIVATGTAESTVATMRATASIPIVFVHAVDPVRAGLVASLAKPGGNVTGITSLNADLGAKRLELATEMLPRLRRMAVLFGAADPETPSMVAAVKSAARTKKVALDMVELADDANLDRMIGEAARTSDALLVLGSPPLYGRSPLIAKSAAKRRLPVFAAWREFSQAGGLASYGTGFLELATKAAKIVDRILKGAPVAGLPVEQPITFELVVNLKTAKALGIIVPDSILLRADEVIR